MKHSTIEKTEGKKTKSVSLATKHEEKFKVIIKLHQEGTTIGEWNPVQQTNIDRQTAG